MRVSRSDGSDRSADAAVDTSLAVSESVVEYASLPTEGPSYLRPRPDEGAGSVRSATSESRSDVIGKIGSAPNVSAAVVRSATSESQHDVIGKIGSAPNVSAALSLIHI